MLHSVARRFEGMCIALYYATMQMITVAWSLNSMSGTPLEKQAQQAVSNAAPVVEISLCSFSTPTPP
ncbi:MAG TPA: hypothetical protein VK604_10515 [Bryobacteraceae bacterium]|nr:hypothetical protein [Bryobacteraceae bacterium]HTF69537.1 hypothetical protein [Edaphobacter sp.]